MNYLRQHTGAIWTPQSAPLPGQVENSAGGFSWKVDKWARLRRFLILGSEGGTYYIGERKLTFENVQCLQECIAEDGNRFVGEVCTISREGRAPKNDMAIYALAVALKKGDLSTRRQVPGAVQIVCRTGTHILQFAAFVDGMGGWGRLGRKAVAMWFTSKSADELAFQAVKYPSRYGWALRDLLRLSHPKANSPASAAVYDWILREELDTNADFRMPALKVITGTEALRHEVAMRRPKPQAIRQTILDHRIPREAIPTELLISADVWDALLVDMPMTAMIRNLGNMSKVGLLVPGSEAAKTVCERLTDTERLRKARVHPLGVLVAQAVYRAGKGLRGSGTWNPVPQVVDALNEAFYLAFGNVEPTGKRVLLGIDVSGSMTWGSVAGSPLTPNVAASAMAMVTARVEESYITCGFTHQFTPLPISPKMQLPDVMRLTQDQSFGRTDCAIPMMWAMENRILVDTFVIYTDSETWFGRIHPAEALVGYRKFSGLDAKLIVVGMTSNGFTIADPNDTGMLDVAGFDTATPGIISDFTMGRI